MTIEDEGRVCKDIPESACAAQPENFLKHVLALAATKTGDGLADPKLVLSWLLSALGAPAYLIGLLVPLREAGALLPQLFIAAAIRARVKRKWVWAAGSLVQGFSVLGMAAVAFTLDGAAAGWAIVGLVAISALARSACSVSYKDVLGKTVSKATRGSATGTAGSLAAALVLLFGVLLSLGFLEKSVPVIAAVLCVAAGLWLLAAAVFSSLAEAPGASEGGGNPLGVALSQAALLREDPQLVRFITTRGMLIATALAPPYMLTLAGQVGGAELGALGPFVVASAVAGVSSSFIWGRLSDASSRRVLMRAAALAALALGMSAALGFLAGSRVDSPELLVLFFLVMVAHQGVRLGRSTHIVDMADPNSRAAYTALSNTIVGVLLVIGGVFGVIAQVAGEAVVLAFFALSCVAAIFTARGLREVQD
ncbi:MAG: hypothetical protein QNJ30_04180 [Kiloniellales bacterium]|nr:hypothetical protein [Kiloniellales bacterium]